MDELIFNPLKRNTKDALYPRINGDAILCHEPRIDVENRHHQEMI